MKNRYRTLIALVLFATLNTPAFDNKHGIVETWRCFDTADSRKEKAIIELVRGDIFLEEFGFGEISVSGRRHVGAFSTEGLNRRWDFISNKKAAIRVAIATIDESSTKDMLNALEDAHMSSFSFVIFPNGTGAYYDFSQVSMGKGVRPSIFYSCVSP